MSPEVLQGIDIKANPAIDLWALGVMLYCMVFYKFPFNGAEGNEVKQKITTAEVKFPKDTPTTDEL